MPLYDFRCATCGDFDAWRSLAESSLPMPCPTCETPAKRFIVAPNINLNSGGLSLRRSEAKEPKRVQRSAEPKPTRNQVAHGRPWMLSHE